MMLDASVKDRRDAQESQGQNHIMTACAGATIVVFFIRLLIDTRNQ